MSLQDIWNTFAGTVSDSDYNKLPQVQGPNQSAYQIQGLGNYQNAMQAGGQAMGGYGQQANQQLGQLGQQQAGLYGQIGANTAPSMQQQQALTQYLQSVAMGQAPSAADQMLQNQNARLGQQMQSQMVGAQGMNPALAMRMLFQNQTAAGTGLGAQGAQQKLQEQQAFGNMAQQGNQANFSNAMNVNSAQMANINNQLQTAQAQYENNMKTTMAQNAVAQGIFNSNREQTSYNTQFAQQQQAFQMFMRQEAMQHAQDNARATASALHALLAAGASAGGSAIGGLMAAGVNGGVSALEAQTADSQIDPTTGRMPGSYQDPSGYSQPGNTWQQPQATPATGYSTGNA